MAKQLIPEELNELIQEYLTDGVLTDKERQVILRKAEKLGLDRDEIDLYLDAQVQKFDQATDAAVRRQKGKTCPYCGAPIPQLTDKCPECGQFITPEASEELKEIIDNLEDALVHFKSGKDFARSKATVERYVRKAKMYYSNNPKIKPLLLEVEKEKRLAETAAKVQEMKNFFKQPFLISCYAAVINIIIFVIMYINAQAKLSTIPETHKTGFFSMKTPYEEQQDTIFLIIMMGFIITAAIIGAGIYFQRNRKK